MDISKDDLVSNTKELSKVITTFGGTLIVISVYIMQRGVSWADGNVLNEQSSYHTLSFSYASLSILWPIIILLLSKTLLLLLQKKRIISTELKKMIGSQDGYLKFISLSDHFYSYDYQSSNDNSKLISRLSYLPVLAIIVHMLIGFWLVCYPFIFLFQGGENGKLEEGVSVLAGDHPFTLSFIIAIFQVISSFCVLFFIRSFPSKLKKYHKDILIPKSENDH
jgi:hypothetical protein